MKKLLYLLAIQLLATEIDAKIIVMDMAEKKYAFNTASLRAGKRACFVVNALMNEATLEDPYAGNRAFVAFQIFDMKKEGLKKLPLSYMAFDQFVAADVLPSIHKDRTQDLTNLIGAVADVESQMLVDSLIVKDKGKITLYTGIIKTDFFNVIGYDQFSPEQSNQTLLNTKSPVVSVTSWSNDSIPVFNANYIDRKIFLYSKVNSDFFFYKIPEQTDAITSFTFGFLYRENTGIIQLKSRFLERNKEPKTKALTPIIVSDKYFTFK